MAVKAAAEQQCVKRSRRQRMSSRVGVHKTEFRLYLRQSLIEIKIIHKHILLEHTKLGVGVILADSIIGLCSGDWLEMSQRNPEHRVDVMF